MELSARSVGKELLGDALLEEERPAVRDLEARLFPNLPCESLRDRLAGLDTASRQTPLPGKDAAMARHPADQVRPGRVAQDGGHDDPLRRRFAQETASPEAAGLGPFEAKRKAEEPRPQRGGRHSEVPPEEMCEVAVARVAELEREVRQPRSGIRDAIERAAQPDLVLVLGQREARLTPEDVTKMERRASELPRELGEIQRIPRAQGDDRLRRLPRAGRAAPRRGARDVPGRRAPPRRSKRRGRGSRPWSPRDRAGRDSRTWPHAETRGAARGRCVDRWDPRRTGRADRSRPQRDRSGRARAAGCPARSSTSRWRRPPARRAARRKTWPAL